MRRKEEQEEERSRGRTKRMRRRGAGGEEKQEEPGVYLLIVDQDVLDDRLSGGLPVEHPDVMHLVPPDLSMLLVRGRRAPRHFN